MKVFFGYPSSYQYTSKSILVMLNMLPLRFFSLEQKNKIQNDEERLSKLQLISSCEEFNRTSNRKISFEYLKLLKIPYITEFTSFSLSFPELLFYVFPTTIPTQTMFIPSDEHDAALIKKDSPPTIYILYVCQYFINHVYSALILQVHATI